MLLDDFERGALALARSDQTEKGADRGDGFAVFANHFADIILMATKFENDGIGPGNFSELDCIGIVHDVDEDLFDVVSEGHDQTLAVSAPALLRFLRIRLLTVLEMRAPWESQYSSRSCLIK